MDRRTLLAEALTAVEKSPVGGRPLDAEVEAALFGGWPSHRFSRETDNGRVRHSYGPGVVFESADPDVNGGHVLTSHHRNASPSTTSIDAAVALLARIRPEAIWLRKDPSAATVAIPSSEPKGWATHHDGGGADFPLSLVAAILRAELAACVPSTS